MIFGEALSIALGGEIQTYEQAFGAKDITSPEMTRAIQEWASLYLDGKAHCDTDSSARIPYVVVDGIEKACFGEYSSEIDQTTEKGKRLAVTLENLSEIRTEAFLWSETGGLVFLKPTPVGDNFAFSVVKRTNMLVFGRNRKAINDVGISELTVKNLGGKILYYTLLERRTADEHGMLTVTNSLYESRSANALGKRVPLSQIDEYARLQDTYTFGRPMFGLGLIPVAIPIANCVDGSRDSVAVFAAATDRIKRAYWQEQRTQNEYELTEPHALVSDDVLPPSNAPADDLDSYLFSVTRSDVKVPKYIQAVMDGDMGDGVGITLYNPIPHQEQLESRSNQILRDIENILNLRRGFLSQVESEDRTATEVISTSTRMAHLIESLQKMWEGVEKEVVRVCDLLGQIYYGWDSSEPPPVEIEWGNGVLYDEDKDYDQLRDLVADGILKPEYLLAWKFNKKIRDAKRDLAAIREEYMPELADVE